MNIEKFISPFIESQFPTFYQEEGPVFIDFVKAYYEWLESQKTINSDNVIRESRSLLEYRDIDTTLESYVKYFKNKYIATLPENILADKKLLLKHILDLYRSKGTDKSYKLLFRLLFNEDIDIYVPSEYLFKLSDNEWTVNKYIEISDSPYLFDLIGKEIYSSSNRSTAIIENYTSTNVNNKQVNVLFLSNIKGNFKYGERILCDDLYINSSGNLIDYRAYSLLSDAEKSNYNLALTTDNAPIIFGSLSSISITNGGINYEVGDLLTVRNSGFGGVARVAATRSRNGEVTFELISGGTGFSLDAVVSVDGKAINIVNATQTDPVVVTTASEHGLNSGDSIRIDFVEGMDEINTSNYQYFVDVINSTSFSLYLDITLTTSVDGTGYGAYFANTGYIYINTGGEGATFDIGSIVNKQIYKINTDHIIDYYNTVLESTVSGFTIEVANVNGTFTSGDQVVMNNVNTIMLDCQILTQTLLANGENLSNSSLGIANLTVVNSDDSLLQLKGSDITNANLTSNVILVSNTSATELVINTKYNGIDIINATANVVFVNSSVVSVNNCPNSYFVVGEKIYDTTSGANAVIVSVKRETDWGGFDVLPPPFDLKNLDSQLSVLVYVDKEVGTIASLTNINPGSGYSLDPVVSIVEPLIYQLDIYEPFGPYAGTRKGFNAVVNANAGTASGIVTAIKVVDSGFGYDRNQVVQLISNTNPYAVTGTTVVDLAGVSMGYWKDNKSFASDNIYLQDSYYYQNYSYEIIASRMLNTYENYVKNLVHPTGTLLFGRYAIKNEFYISSSILQESSFLQS